MNPQNPYGSYQSAYNADPGKKKRIMLVAGGGVFLLLLALTALTFLGGPSKDRTSVAKLVALNAEMTRVSDLALEGTAARNSARNLAAIARLMAIDNQGDIVAYMTQAYGEGVSDAEIKSVINKEIDAFLLKAGERNTYDEDFTEVMKNLLEDANEEAANANALAKNEQLRGLMARVSEKNQTLLDGIDAMATAEN